MSINKAKDNIIHEVIKLSFPNVLYRAKFLKPCLEIEYKLKILSFKFSCLCELEKIEEMNT